MQHSGTLRRTFLLVLITIGLTAACASDEPESGAIHLLSLDGGIGPITERYIDRGINKAENSAAKLIVIEIDTPGGFSSSMREIVQRIEASNVPIVVYVSPWGARAASAGTFVTMAAHIAVMAPNTSIGAAAAINADGSDIEGTLGKKVENDAVAFIRGIAELRGRNADWAEEAVREATAATQSEAVELNVVDFVAEDISVILQRIEGRTIELKPGVTVTLTGLLETEQVKTGMTVWERMLVHLANPTLATILISLGMLGLFLELSNPGAIFPGVAGVLAIAIGFLAMGVLPVDTIGLVLIGAGLAFLALELFVPSGGILAGGGVVGLVLGAIIAFRNTPTEFQPNYILVAILAVVLATVFISMAVGLARARKIPSQTGTEALVGKIAVVRTPLTPDGMVFIEGERWQAEIAEGFAHEGEQVRVISASGLKLTVTKEHEA
ncbi:MAG: peptidase [Dehalococcoidia bacterium]|nr:peptidase [Dehalococcoidia bacterium]|tara:strand:+ start:6612 stop:7931 length:1320 start_codon:yes stop_codon:yes gene_type:complete